MTAVAWDEAIDTSIFEYHIVKTIKDNARLRRYDLDVDFCDRLDLREGIRIQHLNLEESLQRIQSAHCLQRQQLQSLINLSIHCL